MNDLTGREEVRSADELWSVPLPEADAGQLLALPDDSCLVATSRFLASVDSAGRMRWLVEMRPQWPPGRPVRLSDGRVAREESDLIVVRRPDTGEMVAGIPAPGASPLAVAPSGGDLVFGTWHRQEGAHINRCSPEGRSRWRRPLARPLIDEPLVVGQWLLLLDGEELHGYDLDGSPQWTIRCPVRGPLVPMGSGLVLVGSDVVEAATGRVHRLDPEVPVHSPVVAVGPSGGLVAAGPTDSGTRSVLRLEVDGLTRWTHHTPAEPRYLLVDAEDLVFVVSTPTLERWRKYHHWYNLSGDCFVRSLGPSGGLRWEWRPGVPLTYVPAVGGPGRLLIGAPGRLWALS